MSQTNKELDSCLRRNDKVAPVFPEGWADRLLGAEQSNDQALPDDVITWGDSIKAPDRVHLGTLQEITRVITDPANQPIIHKLRLHHTKEQRNALKKKLKYFLMGKFSKRANEAMEYMVGMCLDYDDILRQAQDDKQAQSVDTGASPVQRQAGAHVATVQNDPFHFIQRHMPESNYIWCAFISPSGLGIKIIVLFNRPIKIETEYRKVYAWVQKMIDKQFGIVSDKTPDPARATFISYDPNIYVNPRCTRLPVDMVLSLVQAREDTDMAKRRNNEQGIMKNENKEWIPDQSLPRAKAGVEDDIKEDTRVVKGVLSIDEDFERAREVVSKLAQITFDYKDFVKVGMAIRAGFGDRGKELFDMFLDNPNYNDTQQTLDTHWRSFASNHSVKLASLYYVGAKYGCN